MIIFSLLVLFCIGLFSLYQITFVYDKVKLLDDHTERQFEKLSLIFTQDLLEQQPAVKTKKDLDKLNQWETRVRVTLNKLDREHLISKQECARLESIITLRVNAIKESYHV